MKQIRKVGPLVLASLILVGCKNDSQRLADMAERTVEMQSEQNKSIAKASKEHAEVNQAIQVERRELNAGFRQLEKDRKELHQQRKTELAWSEALRFLAIVVAASMPLFLCAYLIWSVNQKATDPQVVNEVLLQELVSPAPRLIAGPNHQLLESSLEQRPEVLDAEDPIEPT